MSGTIKFPTTGWLVYPDTTVRKEVTGKDARWFAEEADKAFAEQARFSADATSLLTLAQEKKEDEEQLEALLRSINHLINRWDSAFCKQHQHIEELINRLHAAETLAGEQA